jgi:hypothetical protein
MGIEDWDKTAQFKLPDIPIIYFGDKNVST